jgi:hypothetical protein
MLGSVSSKPVTAGSNSPALVLHLLISQSCVRVQCSAQCNVLPRMQDALPVASNLVVIFFKEEF